MENSLEEKLRIKKERDGGLSKERDEDLIVEQAKKRYLTSMGDQFSTRKVLFIRFNIWGNE